MKDKLEYKALELTQEYLVTRAIDILTNGKTHMGTIDAHHFSFIQLKNAELCLNSSCDFPYNILEGNYKKGETIICGNDLLTFNDTTLVDGLEYNIYYDETTPNISKLKKLLSRWCKEEDNEYFIDVWINKGKEGVSDEIL